MRSAAALLDVQIESAHRATPVHNDTWQILLLGAVLAVLACWGHQAWRRHTLEARCERARGRVVSTIGDDATGMPLAVVEYVAAGHRYHLPALVPRCEAPPAGETFTVFYDRSDPSVARLGHAERASHRAPVVWLAVVAGLGVLLLM